MKGESETIRQDLLEHHLQLRKGRLARRVGLGEQIELFAVEPGGSAGDLTGMKIVGQLDQVTQCWARRMKHPTIVQVEMDPWVVAGLDRGHFKHGSSIDGCRCPPGCR